MSCPSLLYPNEIENVLEIVPVDGTSGTLTLAGLPPPNNPFSFSVVGNVATVTFATNAFGGVTSVVADIVAAFNANPTMSAIALAVPLASGVLPDFPQSQSWNCGGAPVTITLGLKGMKVYAQ